MQKELFVRGRVLDDRYTYFLLALSVSAIAIAVEKTSDVTWSWPLWILAFACLSWAFSFCCGCIKIWRLRRSFARTGVYLLLEETLSSIKNDKVQEGVRKEIGDIAETQKGQASEADKKVQFWSVRQFEYLVLGGILYVGWHCVEIALRSLS